MPSQPTERITSLAERGSHLAEMVRIDSEAARYGAGGTILGGIGSGVLISIFGPGVDPVAVALACAPLAAAAWSMTSDLAEGGWNGWAVGFGVVASFVVATIAAAALAWILGVPFGSVPEALEVNGGLPAYLALAIGGVVGIAQGRAARAARIEGGART